MSDAVLAPVTVRPRALQLSAGVHFMQVSKWMGHANYTLTLNTYGEWRPAGDGGAPNNLPEPVPAPAAAKVGSLLVAELGRLDCC